MVRAPGADVLVIGAGVVGLTAALEMKRRHPDAQVTVLDKEPEVGRHASSRNSGVLHAGLYYPPGSLKSRFARDGNRAMARYCEARGLPIRRCGKLVVARSEADHPGLEELHRRAQANAVPLEWVDADEVGRIEPRARTVGRALFAPETCVVDPGRVMAALAEDARAAGIHLRLNSAFVSREGTTVHTTTGPIEAGFVVNAAGLYADRVARAWGRSEHYRVLPFKGLYLLPSEPVPLACHVYPVPDLALPFLGVHFTVTVTGSAKIGPTAIPAPWREAYGGMRGFSAAEALEIGSLQARLFLGDPKFRALARHEIPKQLRGPLLRRASSLLQDLEPGRWRTWGRPGIRAQLLDTRTHQLVLDFCVESDDRSLHVLNAISPAFTCSVPFAGWLCDQVEAVAG